MQVATNRRMSALILAETGLTSLVLVLQVVR